MYAAVSWVPRGVATAKLPEALEANAEEDETAMAVDRVTGPGDSARAKAVDAMKEALKRTGVEGESGNDDEGAVSSDEEPLDVAEVLANDLDTLSFHQSNKDDPYLAGDPSNAALFDEDEVDDLTIRSTDALIIAAKSGEDASMLEFHLLEDDPSDDEEDGPYIPHVYVHHDLVLPALPLCAAYTRLVVGEDNLNLVAVGMFTPGIDIWDVERVNNLEPLVSLGGYEGEEDLTGAAAAAAAARGSSKKKKSKKKPKLRLREGSHKDAVMSLSWNIVQGEYLASGSADSTVKVWDIESAHCACTLQHHTDKVQSVAFHPSNAETLLTGSFDKTVHVVDVRQQASVLQWAVDTDVESCHWGRDPTSSELVIVATEDGYISMFDARKTSGKKKKGTQEALAKWKAHDGAASACSVSTDILGLMVTGGVDKFIKVWDIDAIRTGSAPEPIYERPSRAGALFGLSLCPASPSSTASIGSASPFVVAFGGAKGSMVVTDLAAESEAVRDRFLKHASPAAAAAIKRRAARGTLASNAAARKRATGVDGDVMENCDSDDSDSEGSSGWESDHDA